MIVELPTNGVVTEDGDYAPAKGYGAGWPISIEVTGTFDGATVSAGFVSSDDTPLFIADIDAAGAALIKTAAGRWISSRPASGKPAIKVASAGVNTEILVKIIDLTR